MRGIGGKAYSLPSFPTLHLTRCGDNGTGEEKQMFELDCSPVLQIGLFEGETTCLQSLEILECLAATRIYWFCS